MTPQSRSVYCPVCWGVVTTTDPACTRCQTRHHEDCFTFFGGCALFGCGSTSAGPPTLEESNETIVVGPSVDRDPGEGPRRLPRGVLRRVLDAGWCSLHNWKLVALAAFVQTTISITVAFLMGTAPSSVDPFEPPDLSTSSSIIASGLRLANDMGLLTTIVGTMLVLGLVERAQGKERSVRVLFRRSLGRLVPVLAASARACLWIVGPPLLLYWIGVSRFDPVDPDRDDAGGFLALVGMVWVILIGVRLGFAPVVAALADEGRAGDPLARSRELWRAASFQVLWAFIGGGIVICLPLILIEGVRSSFTATPCLAAHGLGGELCWVLVSALVGVIFWLYDILVYFECRRLLEPTYLPFAPTAIAGGRRD